VREYKEIKRELELLKNRADELRSSINLDVEKVKLSEYEQETFKESFWTDQERSAKVNQEMSKLRRHIAPWDELTRELNDSLELIEIAQAEADTSVLEDIEKSIVILTERFERIQTLELLSDQDDMRNAYLTVHPGAGGTDRDRVPRR